MSNAAVRKKRLNLLQDSLSRIRVDIATHKINTVKECLEFLGLSEYGGLSLDKHLSIDEFNRLIAFPIEERLREQLLKESEEERLGIQEPAAPEEQKTTGILDVGFHAEHPLDKTPWALLSTHSCILLPHQTKAAKDIIWKLFIDGYRATLLQAGVGVGKTFIFFKVIKELWERNWFLGKTFTPWPVLIITKASIIRQTERVGKQHFGLHDRQFMVLNYDALRSSKGMNFYMNWEWKVKDGVRKKVIKWKPGLEPALIVVDECQCAKNEESQQSEVVQQMSNIANLNTRIIFSSATPLTRISEAKYLCVNLNMDYKLV